MTLWLFEHDDLNSKRHARGTRRDLRGWPSLKWVTPPRSEVLAWSRSKAVTVGSQARLKNLADVPTMIEQGATDDPLIPNYFAIAAPAKTPPAAIQMLNAAVARAVVLPDVVEKLEANGLVAAASSPSATAESVGKDIARFGRLLRNLGLVAN
jgi:tripartite-type tricarboxylate transporter receptor subunit TctC